jgi:catechol 2,3-dioxygenase-like lactoylglutathione lyase family enzyme
MVHTYGLTHINLVVRDVARSLRFYGQVFGVEEYGRSDGLVHTRTPGCHDVITNALSSTEMIAKDPLQRLLCMGRSRKPTSDVSRQNDENGMAFGNFNAILPFFNGPLQGSLPDTLPAGAI